MGRDQTFGRVWTRIHPKYGSPAMGTVLIMAIAIAHVIGLPMDEATI
jgi:amino acid transporter